MSKTLHFASYYLNWFFIGIKIKRIHFFYDFFIGLIPDLVPLLFSLFHFGPFTQKCAVLIPLLLKIVLLSLFYSKISQLVAVLSRVKGLKILRGRGTFVGPFSKVED